MAQAVFKVVLVLMAAACHANVAVMCPCHLLLSECLHYIKLSVSHGNVQGIVAFTCKSQSNAWYFINQLLD